MTGAGEWIHEGVNGRPEICAVSLETARNIARPIFDALQDGSSVLYAVASKRMAGMPLESGLDIAPLLLNDPARSGVVVERYRQQHGALPDDASDSNPARMTVLWEAQVAQIP